MPAVGLAPETIINQLPFNLARLIELCRQNDVTRLRLFGSMVRGEARADSDIDLLVDFAKPKSLLAHIIFEQQLSQALGRPVDLLTEAALSPYLRDHITAEAQVLYATS